jgi:hypothetical protein
LEKFPQSGAFSARPRKKSAWQKSQAKHDPGIKVSSNTAALAQTVYSRVIMTKKKNRATSKK